MPQSPAPADAAANPLTGDFQVDIAKSKDLYKRFLAMEQGARSIVASCRSEHGIHLWPVVRRAYFADFYRGNAAVYINKNLSVQIGIVEKARSIPKNFLKILTASPKNLGIDRKSVV